MMKSVKGKNPFRIVPSSKRIRPSKNGFRGCIIGGAVGDALGMPVECLPKGKKEELGLDQITKYKGHPRGKLQAGQWTDDTLLTLATVESIIEHAGLNVEAIRQKMSDFILFDPYRGSGRTTTKRLEGRAAPAKSAGNGAAMRIAPVALFSAQNLEVLRQNCEAVCRITHSDKDAVDAAVAVAYIVARAVRGELKPKTILEEAKQFLGRSEISYKLQEVEDLLRTETSPQEGLEIIGTRGLALESVASSIFAFLTTPHDFLTSVSSAVNYSWDADTIGSMTGSMSGAFNGIYKIPKNLLSGLEDKQRLFFNADQLYLTMTLQP